MSGSEAQAEKHVPLAHSKHGTKPCGCQTDCSLPSFVCTCGAAYNMGMDGPSGFPVWRCLRLPTNDQRLELGMQPERVDDWSSFKRHVKQHAVAEFWKTVRFLRGTAIVTAYIVLLQIRFEADGVLPLLVMFGGIL